jgi:AcrR family transcriptional regulator
MQLCISGNIAVMTTVITLDEGLRARKKRETRHALHRAAIELLHEGDFCDVTIDAIAARAGVSPRTFFNYFPAKEAALSGTDPDMVARAREFMLARPATEDTVTAVRGATLERLRELVVDAELWQMRRAVSQRHPEFAAGLVGANALAERAIAQAACERLGADPLTDVTPMATAYAALGAIRAALQQHVSAGFAGSIEERIDAALAAVGLWPRP